MPFRPIAVPAALPDFAITDLAMPGLAERHAGPDLRKLLELACDWYWTLDTELRLVQVDGRLLDDGPSAIRAEIGRRPWEWAGMVLDAGDFPALRLALTEHRPFHDATCTMRDPRGLVRYLVLSGEPDFVDGRFVGFDGTSRDVTLHHRAEALVVLEHAITRSLAEATTSRKVLQAVMRIICESEQWETCGYFRVDDDAGSTRLVAGWSGPGIGALATDYYKDTAGRVVPPGGMISKVIATAKPLWVSELKESQTSWTQRLASTGERAVFFCPVMQSGRVIGVFAFSSRDVREPDERLLQTMQAIGEQVGQFLRRREAEQVLRESEARFRALTDLSSDWYWEMGADFRLTRIEGRESEPADALPGRSSIGKAFWETGLAIDQTEWATLRARLDEQLPLRDVVLKHDRIAGGVRYIGISGEPIRDQHGAFAGYRGVGRDVSERRQAELNARHLATHDALTGLPNRLLFDELLTDAIGRRRVTNRAMAVLFIDLDRLKAINDTLGHDAGDALLRETARRLGGSLRTSDVVARLGGDEFVVIAQQIGEVGDVVDIARKILAAVAVPMRFVGHEGEHEIAVTASIGISILGTDADDGANLLKQADVAMYAAKQRGRNAFSVYASTTSPDAAGDIDPAVAGVPPPVALR